MKICVSIACIASPQSTRHPQLGGSLLLTIRIPLSEEKLSNIKSLLAMDISMYNFNS